MLGINSLHDAAELEIHDQLIEPLWIIFGSVDLKCVIYLISKIMFHTMVPWHGYLSEKVRKWLNKDPKLNILNQVLSS